MKTTQKSKTVLKATLVIAVALAFLLPSATAFTTKPTSTQAKLITQKADVKFQKITSDTAAAMGRGTDVIAAGEVGEEYTPAIVRDGTGNLWIFYVFDYGSGPDIYMRQSTDNGQTWSTAWYLPVDGIQNTPVATVDATGMLWVAFIDEGQDTQYLLAAQDPSAAPTDWNWTYFTPSTTSVYNHNMGSIATYQTDRTIAAFTYIADIVYPPYSVASAAVVTHNGDPTQYTYSWDSTWNGRPATYSALGATNSLFFFGFQYTNSTVGKEIINVRWGDPVTQSDMEQWKTQWGSFETSYSQNSVKPTIGASGTNAVVIYQSDAAGNQDLMCSYTTDNGGTWTHNVVVANSAVDEVNPHVSMSGANAYCLYMKDGNLFLTTSTDAGATWGAPTQINDQDGTVVNNWHMASIYYPFIAWTDSRGSDQDIYFDLGGAPQLLPHLTISGITGGVGVSATITNDGDANATNIACTLSVTGGILGKINVEKTISSSTLAVGAVETIKSGLFLGLGTISITISATCDEGVSASQSSSGKILFFYVKI